MIDYYQVYVVDEVAKFVAMDRTSIYYHIKHGNIRSIGGPSVDVPPYKAKALITGKEIKRFIGYRMHKLSFNGMEKCHAFRHLHNIKFDMSNSDE